MWICWAARARSGKRITSGPVGPFPRVTENTWPCPYPRLRVMSGWQKTFESHRSAHRGIDQWDVISGRGGLENRQGFASYVYSRPESTILSAMGIFHRP